MFTFVAYLWFTRHMTHLHAQACFTSSEWQHFNFHLLASANHVSNIGYASFFT